jgi:glutamate-1-semialdehyde aminotransferase
MGKEDKSKDAWKIRAANVLAQGFPGVNSKRWTHYPENFPAFLVSGSRCYVTDVAGRKYTDFVCALGAISVGYADMEITSAAVQEAWRGNSLSLPSTKEVETGESIQAILPMADRVRFLKSGNEATLAAVRISRAATGRQTVLTDGYHGHGDLWTSLTSPHAGVVDSFKIQPLDWEALDLASAACVIVEAIKLDDSPAYQERLRNLRDQCKRFGTVFIMDEVVTGFRVPEFTVSQWWKLYPDIVILGKGMANGFELSAVCGTKEVMDNQDFFISSTFSGSSMALAAAKATIDKISTKLNLNDLMFYAKRFQKRLNALHTEINFDGYGTRCMLNTESPTTALFMQEMCKAGVLFGKAYFFNFAHLEEDVESKIINIAEGVIEMMKQGKCKYEGPLPGQSFQRNR